MRNKKSTSKSAKVITFLKTQSEKDERSIAAKKIKPTGPKKSKAIKKKAEL